MSNKFNEYLERFKRSNIFDLFQAYKNPSARKICAYYELIERNKKITLDKSIRIIGYNCDFFTLATYIPDINIIIIDTYAHSYVYHKEQGFISWKKLIYMIEDYNATAN